VIGKRVAAAVVLQEEARCCGARPIHGKATRAAS
jgi:hypothetical protein